MLADRPELAPIVATATALHRTGRYGPERAVELALDAVYRAAGRRHLPSLRAVTAWHTTRRPLDLAHGGRDPRVVELARYVRTAAGAARYGQPIGSLITNKGRKSRALSGGELSRRALERRKAQRGRGKFGAMQLSRMSKSEQRRALAGVKQPDLYAIRRALRDESAGWSEPMRGTKPGKANVAAQDAIDAELGRRVDTRVKGMSDDQLADAITSSLSRNRLAEFDRYAAEEQRRADAREKTVERRRARAAAERDRKAAEYERLLTAGEDPMEAEAAVYGTSVKKQREQAALAWLRANGHYGDNLREAARSAYTRQVEEAYSRAEDDTRGTLLTNAAEARGIDPVALFIGPEARARKWASEELRSWWDVNGRPTFDEFLAELVDDPASAARSRNARSDFLA